MNHRRINSLDKLDIDKWNWQWFMDSIIQYFSIFDPKPFPIPPLFLNKEEFIGNKKESIARTFTWACQTRKIWKARAVCVDADKRASVLNFVATPNCHYDLPFFGADFVTLPAGHLLALDLQPALKNDLTHTENVWKRLIPIHKKWQSLLPYGGPIPIEAKPFFSPGFLWTRIPLGSEGDRILEEVLKPAFIDYLDLYIDLINQSKEVEEQRAFQILQGQRHYMNYRAKKDPARAMLQNFYGKEWTEEYINRVLFDLE